MEEKGKKKDWCHPPQWGHITCLHDAPGTIYGSAGWKTNAVGSGANPQGSGHCFQKMKQNVT